jgi:predicted DNA-binding protein
MSDSRIPITRKKRYLESLTITIQKNQDWRTKISAAAAAKGKTKSAYILELIQADIEKSAAEAGLSESEYLEEGKKKIAPRRTFWRVRYIEHGDIRAAFYDDYAEAKEAAERLDGSLQPYPCTDERRIIECLELVKQRKEAEHGIQ